MSKLGLLSRTESQASVDWRQISSQGKDSVRLILIGGQEGSQSIPYMRALLDPGFPGTIDRLILGRSISEHLPERIVKGLAAALKLLAPSDLIIETMEDAAKMTELVVADDDLKLGCWLIDSLRACDESGNLAPSLKEMEYFVGSGAYRAQALATALRAGFQNEAYRAAVDIGAGIGLLPYLLAPTLGIQQVTLIEPLARYEQTARCLWQTTPGLEMQFFQMTAEQQCESTDNHDRADLIIICQCFFRVSASRRQDVLARAWNTLKPGGVLAMNEILDSGGRVGPGGAPLLTVKEMTALFADWAQPRVHLGRDRWKKGHLICDLDRSAFGSDTFIVAQKTTNHP